jgi:polyhydroxybutyrate depolymerase
MVYTLVAPYDRTTFFYHPVTSMQREIWLQLLLLFMFLLTSCQSEALPQQSQRSSSNPKLSSRITTIADGAGQLTVQGQIRSYWLHTPKSHSKNTPLPLVVAFHGYGSQGKDLARSSGLNALADQAGFVVVYPDGLDRRWNLGESFDGSDDVDFTAELIKHLTQIRAIDQRRIYAIGVSNGGFLVHQLACVSHQRSLPISAFASVAATLPQPVAGNCHPPAPIPMLMINGTADQKVPWQGGARPYGTILSVPQTIEFWRQRNGCRANPQSQQRFTSQVTITRYPQCQSKGKVELVTLEGAGHVFPRGGGGKMGCIDASEEAWRFFQRHSS